jgi:hypothetical protein
MAVNAVQLCTYSDWRMPTIRELYTLVYSAGLDSSIDPAYFPNTPYTGGTDYWSGSTYVGLSANAWAVIFFEGDTFVHEKTLGHRVRLVRGGQF